MSDFQNSNYQPGELNYSAVTDQLVSWLQKKVKGAGARGGVIGLSGGLDSSVTAVLAQKAFGEDALGLILPCFSQKEDVEDALKLARKFSLSIYQHKLNSIMEEFMLVVEADKKKSRVKSMAVSNIKPRLRMTVLYYYAAKNNYLVIGTDNWSELKVGYFTKHGDGGIDLAPLGRLVKSEVRELASYLGIPKEIINKPPSAGLWAGQTDEEEMGLTYEQLDRYILGGEVASKIKEKIERLEKKNRHKLQPPPVPGRDKLRKQ